MRIHKNEEAFLELLRCGIWGKTPNSEIFKELTQFDWLEIYMIAGKQTVLGICLKSIMNLPNNMKPPTKLLLQWIGVNRFIEAENYKKMQVWKELNAKFEAVGIFPIVLKGMAVAKWYAHPMSRQSSDIDIFIPERFDECISILNSWGIKSKHKSQHDTIVYKGVTIEIHPDILTTPYKPKMDFTVENEIVGDMYLRVPDANINSILLLSHAAGHFLIPGIGYRFLCDWAVFLKNNYEKIDCKLVLKEARRMGMNRFVTEFSELARVKLGLEFPSLEKWTEGTQKKYLVMLSEELFEQGDFGAINFQKDFKGNKFKFALHIFKSLLHSRYYWPKLFWRRAPKFMYKLIRGYFVGLFSVNIHD